MGVQKNTLKTDTDNELDEFIASVQANKKEDGNKMAIKKQSNLYARMKQLEFEIKEYIKKFAGTTAFDPCEPLQGVTQPVSSIYSVTTY